MHITGEEESGIIGEEVSRIISHRINRLAKQKELSPQIKSHLEERLQETTHRTYLWVYLVFEHLEKTNFKKTPKEVISIIETLPTSVTEAYEQILNKSEPHPMVRKAFNIILAASRPLTLSEINVAVNINKNSKSFRDLDLEREIDFKARLRSWCGLFVSVYDGRVYFLIKPLAIFFSPIWHHLQPFYQRYAGKAPLLCATHILFLRSFACSTWASSTLTINSRWLSMR
jgi:hypothetical protein